ncbi:hypothetical protein ACP4OV_000530 [Aristida adscensionis]
MRPPGACNNLRANSNPSGQYYGNGNGGGGSRYARGQPYRPPAPAGPAAPQMTPREKEDVLMAAGHLAAEYLVARGDLPPDALDNRPPAPPLPFQDAAAPAPGPRAFRPHGRPPGPPPQRRPFHFQGPARPFAPQRRLPRPFQGGGPGSFPKWPRHRQAAARPSPYGARGPAAPPAPARTGYAGQGAAAAAAAAVPVRKAQESGGDSAPAGEATSESQAQPSGAGGRSQQQNQPSSGSVGANASKLDQ